MSRRTKRTSSCRVAASAPSANRVSAGESAAIVDKREVLHAAGRGAVAAMAMSGMRSITVRLGIIEQTPPDAILEQKAKGLIRLVSEERRPAAVELVHWMYGAAGGAAFAMLPDSVRRRAWSGPIYGLGLWLGFEAVIAPGLGLKQAGEVRAGERAALAADHLLYGLVLSELRRRPRA